MKYLILVFCFVFSSFFLLSQETFVKIFDFDSSGGGFYNSLFDNNNVITYGSVKDTTNSQWGISWMKVDSSGDILSHKVHFDSLGDSYILEDGYEIIKTSDGGFAMVGNLVSRNWGFLMKLDINGNLDFVKEYPDENAANVRHRKVIEVSNGYITSGVKQQTDDYKSDAFIMKTNLEGEKEWEIIYGEYDLFDAFYSINVLNTDEILFTGYTTTGVATSPTPNTPPFPTNAWRKKIKIKINLNGDIISEEVSEQLPFLNNENYVVAGQMYSDDNSNWVHKGSLAELEYIPPDPEPYIIYRQKIIKRDSNDNILWETTFGDRIPSYNTFIDLIPTPDNGWLAAGRVWAAAENEEERGYYAGWLAKVNEHGDSLWMRKDTAFYAANPDESTIEHWLNSVVVLPSGSIIATGRLNNYEEEPSRSYGWMIKLDKDGCLEPGCHPNLTGINFTEKLDEFEVYPNPTSDWVKVEGQGKFETEVYDSFGKQVLALEEHQDIGQLDLSLLPSGVYYVNILVGYFIYSKKVVKGF